MFFFQGQSPSIRQLIMHSMAEWYMRGEQYDQAKLSRILDVAQDLKVCQNRPFNCWHDDCSELKIFKLTAECSDNSVEALLHWMCSSTCFYDLLLLDNISFKKHKSEGIGACLCFILNIGIIFMMVNKPVCFCFSSSLYQCCWMVLHLPLLLTLLHLPLAVNTSNLINGWLTKSESMG